MIDRLAPWASFLRHKTGHLARRNALLLVLLGAMLMMPVSYRAGTDQAHVHTIFQGMIDAVVGHQHAHGDQHEQAPAPSPFSRPGVPLAATDDHHATAHSGADSDVPQQVQLAGPVLATAALVGLGALIAALLAGAGSRLLWFACQRLVPIDLSLEPPPPRPATYS